MNKRIKLIIFAAVTAAVSFSACSLKSKENIKLVVKTPPLYASAYALDSDVSTYEFLSNAGEAFEKEYTDADVSVEVVEFDYADEIKEITDCFGTENAPDVVMAGYFNMSSYIYDGNVVPLDDIISDELKADFDPGAFAMSKVNNKVYMMPFYSLYNTLCYNKELFREYGLEKYIGKGLEIQNWSIDDWELILSTLKSKMPEGSYPMMMYAKNNLGDTHIMTLLRSRGSNFFDINGYFNLNTKEGIEAFRWIKDSYDKGYFPENCENMEGPDCSDLFNNNKLGVFFCNNSMLPQVDTGLVNFPSTGSKGVSTAFITGFTAFDNGSKAKLKAAKEFIKFIYSKDEFLDYERAAIPVNKSVIDRSTEVIKNLDEYLANSDTIVDFTANNPNWQGNETSVRSIFWPHIHKLLTGEETPEQCAAAVDEECNASIKEGRDKGNLHE